MKVCVTGANGFVGSKLCQELLARGDQVNGLVRVNSDLQFLRNLTGLEIKTGDITQRESLIPAFEDCEIVYHVAAFASDWGAWEVFRKTNVEAVRNVMEAALESKVRRVVHISSVCVYGFPGGTDIPEESTFVPHPTEPYITTKQEGERIALSYNNRGLEVVALRPGGIYGPNDRTTSLKLIPELEKRHVPFVDAGRYIMAPIYIDNLVQAIILAAKSDKAPGQSYNIMDDGKIAWQSFFNWFCEDIKCKKPVMSVPSWLAWPIAGVVETFSKVAKVKEPFVTKFRIRAVMKDSHYSIRKAKEDLGYDPRVSTREGIRRTVEWYRDYIS